MRVELVIWLDSGLALADGWQQRDYYLSHATTDEMTVFTSGIIMHEDDDVLIVALTHDPSHDAFINAQAIAVKNIIKRQVIFDSDAEEEEAA